jgi:hypothetical protein
MYPTLIHTTKALVVCFALVGSYLTVPRQALAASRFDGTWNLTFVTQRGACDPTYNFTVDVLNGNVTHPNILTFRGHVAQSGAVRASVRVEIRVGIWQIVGSVGPRRLERPLGGVTMHRLPRGMDRGPPYGFRRAVASGSEDA